jgi:hypothetical protein
VVNGVAEAWEEIVAVNPRLGVVASSLEVNFKSGGMLFSRLLSIHIIY